MMLSAARPLCKETDHKIIPITTPQPREDVVHEIVIIGAGAAGTMATKRAVLNNNEVLLFAGAKQERRRSRGNWVRKVDNIPGLEKYERTVLQLRNEALLDLLNSSLASNLYLVEDSVVSITKEHDYFKLTDSAGRSYLGRFVVLATGIMDEQPHIQGSIRPILPYANGQTVAYCLLCDGHRCQNKKTVVIGYGNEAANAAMLLSDRYQPQGVTLLTNGAKPRWNPELAIKLEGKQIKVIEDPIAELMGNDLKLEGILFESGKKLEAQMGFVLLGIRPNNALALQLGAEVDARGLVCSDEKGETSIPGLFVAGDLRANSSKQIYTAWQQAVDVIQTISRRIIAGRK
jgi:thioredoxin reductase (NADPH)